MPTRNQYSTGAVFVRSSTVPVQYRRSTIVVLQCQTCVVPAQHLQPSTSVVPFHCQYGASGVPLGCQCNASTSATTGTVPICTGAEAAQHQHRTPPVQYSTSSMLQNATLAVPSQCLYSSTIAVPQCIVSAVYYRWNASTTPVPVPGPCRNLAFARFNEGFNWHSALGLPELPGLSGLLGLAWGGVVWPPWVASGCPARLPMLPKYPGNHRHRKTQT